MSFSDVVLLKKITQSVISITGAMVALLGGWILISAFSDVPETKLQLPTNSIESLKPHRAPSSVPGYVFTPGHKEGLGDLKVETFNLGCLGDQPGAVALTSMAKQVRIKTQLCSKKLTSAQSSSIINRTNGYVATLFNLEQGGLTSDYITLAEGQNQIMLEIEDGLGGRATAEVTISRQ